MFTGRVEAIYIAPSNEEPVTAVDEVKAIPGMGLVGDRYFSDDGRYADRPGKQITLIEAESVDAVRAGGVDFRASDSRRNLVTRDVPLNHLVGKEFTVGDVRLRGIKLCEPCTHMEALCGKPAREPLVHRGGLNAQILSEGVVRVGDRVVPSEET